MPCLCYCQISKDRSTLQSSNLQTKESQTWQNKKIFLSESISLRRVSRKMINKDQKTTFVRCTARGHKVDARSGITRSTKMQDSDRGKEPEPPTRHVDRRMRHDDGVGGGERTRRRGIWVTTWTRRSPRTQQRSHADCRTDAHLTSVPDDPPPIFDLVTHHSSLHNPRRRSITASYRFKQRCVRNPWRDDGLRHRSSGNIETVDWNNKTGN